MPFLIETSCVILVVVYLALRWADEVDRGRFVLRLASVAVGAWVIEDLAIGWYGLHSYDSHWTYFIGRVPLLAVVAWPFLVHSAWDVSRHLLKRERETRLVPLLGGLVVLLDVAVLVPVGTEAGLLSFSEPGLFGMPPIALLTAAMFGGACIAVWEYNERKQSPMWHDAGMIALTVVATHVAALLAWWILLRWISVELNPLGTLAVVWAMSAVVSALMMSERVRYRLPTPIMLARLWPGVMLLAVTFASSQALLVNYLFAFVMVHLSLMPGRRVALSLQAGSLVRLRAMRAAGDALRARARRLAA